MLPVYPVSTGAVLYPQESIPLTAVGSGSFGFQNEGNTKPLIDYNLTTVTLALKFLAGMARVSREMLSDLPWLTAYLSTSLTEDFKRAEDAAYVPLLLVNAISGSTSETLAAAKVLDYVTQLWTAGRNPTAILASPAAVTAILKTKPNDFSVPGGVQFGPNGEILIFGLPVVPCQFLSGTSVIVGNFSEGAAIAQNEGLNLKSTEFDGTNFSQNLVSFRMEAREGLMIMSPKSFLTASV